MTEKDIKKFFGKVKNPILAKNYLLLRNFKKDLIEEAKKEFELIISNSKARTIIFNEVECVLSLKCYTLLYLLLKCHALEFDKTDISISITLKEFVYRNETVTEYVFNEYDEKEKKKTIVKGRTKDKLKTITYKFNSTTVSKYVSELKSTIKKAYINAGKTTEQFDNDIQSLIRVIRVSSKDSKYTIQTRYIYKYKKTRVRQNKDNTDCIKTSKYVFIMIFSS